MAACAAAARLGSSPGAGPVRGALRTETSARNCGPRRAAGVSAPPRSTFSSTTCSRTARSGHQDWQRRRATTPGKRRVHLRRRDARRGVPRRAGAGRGDVRRRRAAGHGQRAGVRPRVTTSARSCRPGGFSSCVRAVRRDARRTDQAHPDPLQRATGHFAAASGSEGPVSSVGTRGCCVSRRASVVTSASTCACVLSPYSMTS